MLNRRPNSCVKLVAWLAAIAMVLAFALILLRYSTFYHADTTWQLYSIWSVMQSGHSVDFLSSLRPGYLLNVPAAYLFGINLYALRLVTYITALFGLAIFISGIKPGAIHKIWFPIVLVLASVCQLKFTDYIFHIITRPGFFFVLAWAVSGYQPDSVAG